MSSAEVQSGPHAGSDDAAPTAKAPSLAIGDLPQKVLMRRMIYFVRPYGAALVLVLAASGVFSAARFGRAFLMQPVLDNVLMPETKVEVSLEHLGWRDWLTPMLGRSVPEGLSPADATVFEIVQSFQLLVLAALFLVLVTPLAMYVRSYLANRVVSCIRVDIKRLIAAKLLAVPLAFHRDGRTGDILTRVMSDGDQATTGIEHFLKEALLAIVMVVMGSCGLVYISWQLALLSFLTVPPIMLVLSHFGSRIQKRAKRRQTQTSEVSQRLLNILGGIKVIKVFDGANAETSAFSRETAKWFREQMKVVKARVTSKALVEALNSATGILMLMIGALLVLQGRWGLTPGSVAAFAGTLATTYKPVKVLTASYAIIIESLVSADRLFAVLDSPEEPPDAPDAVEIEGIHESIRFRHVGFSYGEARVLSDIDFEVKPGEVIAVVGKTGGGKTTLMDLLLRYHDPSSGAIEIDGVDLRKIKRRSFMNRTAVVTQEPFLFDVSIAENIRYGRPEASDEEVRAACEAARIDDFIDDLPDGFEARVGEFGLRLSGGQRQRITIARAILKRPDLLVFDEATSALDAKTERAVQQAISELRGERTIFLVAHRLSTIRSADRIVVLEDGRVSQIGTHAELVAEGGLYREMVSIQSEA